MIKGIPVRHINYLENFCIDNQPVCAVICIPGSDMQEITDMLVRLGVRAFGTLAITTLPWLTRRCWWRMCT